MFWPRHSSSEFLGVLEDSQVPFSGVWVATSHFPQSGVATFSGNWFYCEPSSMRWQSRRRSLRFFAQNFMKFSPLLSWMDSYNLLQFEHSKCWLCLWNRPFTHPHPWFTSWERSPLLGAKKPHIHFKTLVYTSKPQWKKLTKLKN